MRDSNSKHNRHLTAGCPGSMKNKRTRVQASIALILYVGAGLALWAMTAKLCYFVMSLQKI